MYCILIAGVPAAGKSRFADWLSRRRNLPYMSKDTIKEILFDDVGFQSRAEKVALGNAAMNVLYYFAEAQMRAGLPFLIENNFEDSSRDGILKLIRKYRYTPVTVLFDGEMDVIYQRFIARDQLPERHRGHVINTAYPETGEKAPYVPVPLETFAQGIEQRGFRRFSVGGEMIRVDCTDFTKVDYEGLNRQLETCLKNQKRYYSNSI